MANCTAGTLDPDRMRRIKEIILAKFDKKRSEADREELWSHCKVAIGQKCKDPKPTVSMEVGQVSHSNLRTFSSHKL